MIHYYHYSDDTLLSLLRWDITLITQKIHYSHYSDDTLLSLLRWYITLITQMIHYSHIFGHNIIYSGREHKWRYIHNSFTQLYLNSGKSTKFPLLSCVHKWITSCLFLDTPTDLIQCALQSYLAHYVASLNLYGVILSDTWVSSWLMYIPLW